MENSDPQNPQTTNVATDEQVAAAKLILGLPTDAKVVTAKPTRKTWQDNKIELMLKAFGNAKVNGLYDVATPAEWKSKDKEIKKTLKDIKLHNPEVDWHRNIDLTHTGGGECPAIAFEALWMHIIPDSHLTICPAQLVETGEAAAAEEGEKPKGKK